ncbi:hypothetical protein [Loktanella sp. M215]|uniref:hypothetical protein n=1 Tax=Loktanella sp. M215 TaxID=2675431 RepID=UPI001F215307|nr:hypothetical protein [Loktanella sp. M215]MCF7699917.1 hypothetical protein [Loktanella sp. M215]
MGNIYESVGSLGLKVVVQQIDDLMQSKGVGQETRSAVTNSLEMMYEYQSYAIRQGKNPSDGKVLASFLATKGKHMAKYFGNDSVNCGLAIIELLKSTRTAAAYSKTGNVPLVTLTWGLAMLDLIEVGNRCEPAQQAFYEAVLRKSSVTINPIRSTMTQSQPVPIALP